MQSIAVLLLEMAYKAGDTNTDAISVVPSIRKLMRWLQAMKNNDPVAARAYEVVWRILKACALILQADANEILALDGDEASQANPLQHPQDTFTEQATTYWQQPDFFHNPMVGSGTLDPSSIRQQPFEPLSDYQPNMYASSSANQNSAPMPFGNPFFTNFDQIVPVANMQDLWAAPQFFDHFETDMSDIVYAQNQEEAPHNPERDPFQQQ